MASPEKVLYQKVVEEILHSPEFKDSKRYQELLQFLVDETLAGRIPKEITLGMQFFGKDAKFDPKEDPTVRVSINNLRKKIEHYYLTQSTPYAIKLDIPKGHYRVEFISIDSKEPLPPPQGKKLNTRIIAIAFSVLLLTIIALLVFYKGTPRKSVVETNPIWGDFVKENGKPTLIVLGDFFFLYERSAEVGQGNFIRDWRINSPDDYRQMVSRDLKFAKQFVPSDFTFLRPSASWGLAEVLPILRESLNGYSLKLASDFTMEDFKTNNIVFIGSFKSLFNLQKILHVFNIDYSLSPMRFRIQGDHPDSVRTFSPSQMKGGNYEKDFSIVVKGIGPNNSAVVLMMGFSDSGVIEATRAATDKKMIQRLEEKFINKRSSEPLSFTFVVESEGISQAIFKANIRYFHQRTPQLKPFELPGPDSLAKP